MEGKDRERDFVHRGRVDPGRIVLLQKRFPFLEDLQIEGSLADGPRGSRRCDLDISARRPDGLTPKQEEELLAKIRRETGIDFYFREE